MLKHLIRMVFLLTLFYLTNCQSDQVGQSDKDATINGALIFNRNCKICHGIDGRLGLNGAKDLTASVLREQERIDIITGGKKIMPPFKTVLSEKEIQAVAAFTLSLKQSTSK